MPPFRGTLSLEEGCAMGRYLRTFAPPQPLPPPDYRQPKAASADDQGPSAYRPTLTFLPVRSSGKVVPLSLTFRTAVFLESSMRTAILHLLVAGLVFAGGRSAGAQAPISSNRATSTMASQITAWRQELAAATGRPSGRSHGNARGARNVAQDKIPLRRHQVRQLPPRRFPFQRLPLRRLPMRRRLFPTPTAWPGLKSKSSCSRSRCRCWRE